VNTVARRVGLTLISLTVTAILFGTLPESGTTQTVCSDLATSLMPSMATCRHAEIVNGSPGFMSTANGFVVRASKVDALVVFPFHLTSSLLSKDSYFVADCYLGGTGMRENLNSETHQSIAYKYDLAILRLRGNFEDCRAVQDLLQIDSQKPQPGDTLQVCYYVDPEKPTPSGIECETVIVERATSRTIVTTSAFRAGMSGAIVVRCLPDGAALMGFVSGNFTDEDGQEKGVIRTNRCLVEQFPKVGIQSP